MIPRYARPQMAAIWSSPTKFRIWFEIEAHAAAAMAELGIIADADARTIRQRGETLVFDEQAMADIAAIERETHHDVIAFLTYLARHIGPAARFVHQGMTSSDVLDTCLAVQLTRAADILLADIDALCAILRRRARQEKFTPCMGRSHGIHAEPTTFGLKMAQAAAEFARARARILAARKEIATCAISGAVGTFAHIDPFVERYVAQRMGLEIEPVSTQIIPRDRHAAFFAALAVVAGSVERLATEIRHLQRTEVGEVAEYFAPGQKGSSAMPHKRNPVLSENITGLARLVRSYCLPALENVATWHERDISHSSVERIVAPDATIALDFALARLAHIMENLILFRGRMQANIDATRGLVYSQQVLLKLTTAGVSREEAYRLVQGAAMKTYEEGGTFRDRLLESDELRKILGPDSAQIIDGLCDLKAQFACVEHIMERVFADAGQG